MSSPAAVTFSVDAQGLGWIVFDDPAARANVFNPANQAALAAALDAVPASGAQALIIISAKEKIFVAGADLKWLVALPDRAAVAAAARTGQALFARLADSPVPVVCAIHGACAGGGYELALACDWRIATDAQETVLGLPEVGLGLLPGWGGCVRLPRLLGAEAAVAHILQAQLLPAAAAAQAGLVDELVPPAELRTRAAAAARRLIAEGRPTRPTATPAPADFFDGQRRKARTRAAGQPAPLAVLDLVEASAALPLPAALALEADAFGAVASGDVAKNLVHVFFLKEVAKKLTVDTWFPPAPAAPAPAPIRLVGVVGAGVMGTGIAQWCAARGYGVMLSDANVGALRHGVEVIRQLFHDAAERGRMSPEAAHKAMGSIGITSDLADFEGCDLVIEAVVEDVAIKRELLGRLAAVVAPECLLASNTSALPIEELAAGVPHPGRTVGLHFFNPVGRMPLVELVLSPHTTRATAARALGFVRALGKTPVICRSSPGFLVTRVLFFYLNEACRLWERGVPAAVIDRAMRDWGWPMGPLRLIDEVGVDVTDFIYGELRHYYPARFEGATICQRMLGAGLKGRKNGASTGFYTYAAQPEAPNPAMAALTPPPADPVPDAAAIQQLLNGTMIAETRRVLDEGVIRSADEADLALLMGTGFPAWRGGLMRFARATGQV